jgi:hypothetical protein
MIPNPGYKVRLLKDNCVLASKYYPVISQGHHDQQLQAFILKKTKWSRREFDMVHWDAHEKAFKRLTRHQQIATAKLIHNLANTNQQISCIIKHPPFVLAGKM